MYLILKQLINPPQMPGSNWNESWPSIIQLSYILYDTKNPESAKIPDDVVISEGSMDVHHITREKIATAPPENRATIQDALNEFLDDVKQVDVVVGHNVQFDRKMVVAELLRLSAEDNLPQLQDMMEESNFECTMVQTTPICNLKYKQTYTDKTTGEPKFFL